MITFSIGLFEQPNKMIDTKSFASAIRLTKDYNNNDLCVHIFVNGVLEYSLTKSEYNQIVDAYFSTEDIGTDLWSGIQIAVYNLFCCDNYANMDKAPIGNYSAN